MTVHRPTPAPIVRRALAGVMDYGLLFAVLVAYARIFGEPSPEGGYRVDGCLHSLALVAIWVILLPLPELLWARTLGKAVCGLRVVRRGGQSFTPPDAEAVAKRHLTAFLEMGMCMGLLPLIVIASNAERQRLGDMWAGTLVIDDDVKPEEENPV